MCDAIVEEYKGEQFTTPTTREGWLEVERKFAWRWNYKFLWVHTGGRGMQSDCEIYNQVLQPSLERGRLGLPPPAPLPRDNRNTNYFLAGDDAFPLRCILPNIGTLANQLYNFHVCKYLFLLIVPVFQRVHAEALLSPLPDTR